MDHRCGQRTPVRFSVRLYHRGSLVGTATARNISRGGMYLESPSSLPVVHNAFVELELMALQAKRLTARRLPALVVHRQTDGLGIMFEEVD